MLIGRSLRRVARQSVILKVNVLFEDPGDAPANATFTFDYRMPTLPCAGDSMWMADLDPFTVIGVGIFPDRREVELGCRTLGPLESAMERLASSRYVHGVEFWRAGQPVVLARDDHDHSYGGRFHAV